MAPGVKCTMLLPHGFKVVGRLLLVPALILGVIRFIYGIKPAVLDLNVFTVYSSFLNKKCFAFIQNNFSEEITGSLLIIALTFIALSKEKVEDQSIASLRAHTFILSLYANSILILLSILFVFGFAFVHVLIGQIFSFFIIYLIVFNIYKQLHFKAMKHSNINP